MEVAIALFVTALLVTLIGHGSWVFLAWLLRGGRSRKPHAFHEPTLSDDRTATARYLGHLRSVGSLDDKTHASLMRLIAEDAHPAHSVESYLSKKRRASARDAGEVDTTPRPDESKSATYQPRSSWWSCAHCDARNVPSASSCWRCKTPQWGSSPPESPPPAEAVPAGIPEQLDVQSAEKVEPVKPAEPAPPPEPRKPFSEMLASFMAEKNIRWGELIGGLLIVGSSTALVISLWSQIEAFEAFPVLKFIIFTLVTAAMFGAGLFVYHRWKLPTTGYTLLVISTLLVPLNVLAFAAFSPARSFGGPVTVIAEACALGLFGWLTLCAGRAVASDAHRLFAAGAVSLSACSLMVRLICPTAGAALLLTAMAPIGLYILVIAGLLWCTARIQPWMEGHTRALFLQLGVHTFACLVPLGLLAYQAGQLEATMRQLAPLVCALSAPALATGLFVRRKLGAEPLAQLRVTTDVIILAAAAVMLAGVCLAWPAPSRLIPAMLLTVSALLVVSRLVPHPALPAIAIALLAGTWVLCVQLLLGTVSWAGTSSDALLRALISAEAGQALVAVVVACALLAGLLARRRQEPPSADDVDTARGSARSHPLPGLSRIVAVMGMVFAGVSLALVTWFGFGFAGDAEHTVWVYLVYAIGAFAAAAYSRSPVPTWVGCVLIQTAVVQAVVFGVAGIEGPWPFAHFAWPTALLLGASACTVATVGLRWLAVDPERVQFYTAPWTEFAVAVSLIATAWMTVQVRPEVLGAYGARSAWLFALFFVLAVLCGRATLMALSQLLLGIAACAGAQHYVQTLPWYQAIENPLIDPRLWQVQFSVVGGLALAWGVLRLVVGRPYVAIATGNGGETNVETFAEDRRHYLWRLLSPVFPTTDRWLAAFALAGALWLSVWSVAPSVVTEHGWSPLGGAFGTYLHANGFGSWCVLIIAVATLVIHMCERPSRPAATALGLALVSGVMLVAADFRATDRVVTMLRWLGASALMLLSIGMWTAALWRGRVRRLLGDGPAGERGSTGGALTVPGAIFGTIVVALTISSAEAIALRTFVIAAGASDALLRLSLVGPCLLVAVSLLGHGVRKRRPAYAVVATGLVCSIVTIVELALNARGGLAVTTSFVVWLVQLNAIMSAVCAFVGRALLGGGRPGEESTPYPRWPLHVAHAGLCIVLLLAAVAVWVQPGAMTPMTLEAGTVWGILAALLLEFGLVAVGVPGVGTNWWSRANIRLAMGAVLIACALARLDTGNWLCYHAYLVGFVVAGGLCIPLGARRIRELIGAGWKETFDVAATQSAATGRELDHDLSCVECDYNLRGLDRSGRCPECFTAVSLSLESAISRLTPQYAGRISHARSQILRGVVACAAVATLFAVRALFDDPQRPWWSSGALLALSVLAMAVAGWAPQRKLAYLAGTEVCLAVTLWWLALGPRVSAIVNLTDLLNLNVIALAVAGLVWFVVERMIRARRTLVDPTGSWPAFHHSAATLSTIVIAALVGVSLGLDTVGQPVVAMTWAKWLALILTTSLMFTCSVEPVFRHLAKGLFVLGLAAVGLALSAFHPAASTLRWSLSLALAVYVLVSSLTVRMWSRSRPGAESKPAAIPWLHDACTVLMAGSVFLALYVSLTATELPIRLLVVLAPILCAAATLVPPDRERQSAMRSSVCALLTIAAILFSWSWVRANVVNGVRQWLGEIPELAVALVVAVAAMTIVAGVANALARPEESWVTALRRVGAGAIGAAAVVLCACAGHEALAILDARPVELTHASVVSLIVALVLTAGCFIAFALYERLDPFRLPDRAKGAYVYAAEVLAAVLALHIRASMPWLFSGFISQYWPLLVMGLSFIATFLAEICERFGTKTLARPLSRTGLFLPALALLDLFLSASQVHFSIVLLTFGALYAVLGGLRRSVTFGVIAVLALNASLWYLLHHTPGLGLDRHPQLWFIPLALAVLAGGHINRAHLSETQRAALHYGCLLTVYLSSTADIFLVGVAQAPWLPLVLAGLSIAGILGGIAFRVRSFLQLGTGFLCLALLTIIWHAATNLGWTWVWYVAGIALGLAMITFFAIFEKKRAEMTALLDEVRTWAR